MCKRDTVSVADYVSFFNIMSKDIKCEYLKPIKDNLGYMVDEGYLDITIEGKVAIKDILIQLGKGTNYIPELLEDINKKGYDNEMFNSVIKNVMEENIPKKMFIIKDYIMNMWLDFSENTLNIKAYVIEHSIDNMYDVLENIG